MTIIENGRTEITVELVSPPVDPAFKADAFTIKTALAALKPAMAKRVGALPVLSGVLVNATADGVTFTVTDLDLTIVVPLPTDHVGRPGRAVVPFALLSDLVAKATAKKTWDICLNVDGDEVSLAFGSRERVLRLLPADEYPRLSNVDALGVERIDVAIFDDVIGAVSLDDARPILTGVLVGEHLVATDSYRLYAATGFDIGEFDGHMIVPGRAVKELLRRGGDATVEWDARNFQATFDDGVVVRTRLIEGEFPNWKGLVPTAGNYPYRWDFPDAVETGEALASVASIGKGGRGSGVPMRFNSEDGKGIEMSMHIQDVGSDRIVLKGAVYHQDRQGPAHQVALNAGYFGDLLKSYGKGEFTMETLDHQKPVIVRQQLDEDREVLRLLMPVRV